MNSNCYTNSNSFLTTKTPINNPSKILSQISRSTRRRTIARSRQQVFNMENQTIFPEDLLLEYGGGNIWGCVFGVGKGLFRNKSSHTHHMIKYLHPPGQNLIDVTVGLCMMN